MLTIMRITISNLENNNKILTSDNARLAELAKDYTDSSSPKFFPATAPNVAPNFANPKTYATSAISAAVCFLIIMSRVKR